MGLSRGDRGAYRELGPSDGESVPCGIEGRRVGIRGSFIGIYKWYRLSIVLSVFVQGTIA